MDEQTSIYWVKYRRIMLSFASKWLRPDDADDVVSVAFMTFYRRVDSSRVERELVSYALYCVRSAMADRYRSGRSRVQEVLDDGLLENQEDSGPSGTEEVELGALLSTELTGVHLDMAVLLYEGYTILAASRILGLRYRHAQRIRDELRVKLAPMVSK